MEGAKYKTKRDIVRSLIAKINTIHEEKPEEEE
jgi:hypothetical protein